MRSLCSEFPCDNPSLHFGGTWVLHGTTGKPAFEANEDTPTRMEAAVAEAIVAESANAEPVVEPCVAETNASYVAAAMDDEPVANDELPVTELRESGIFLSEAVEADELTQPIVLAALAPESELEPQPVTVLAPVVELALAAVGEIADEPEVETARLDDVDAFCMLLETVAVQFGDASTAEVVSSWLRDEDSPMADERAPWLALLRGDECDLSTATASTLDEWASKMLSKASGRDANEIRRELRNRGLAAYGLLAA